MDLRNRFVTTWVAAVVALFCAACRDSTLPRPSAAYGVREKCPTPSSDAYYFPELTLIPADVERDRTERAFAGKFLGSMDAPSFSCGGDLNESYRLLWIHSYRPAVVVSVSRATDGWKADGAEYKHPKTELNFAVERLTQRNVSDDEVQSLLDALDAAHLFIRLPPF